jgi:ubiquinone/menaquinone biosynthesis C-methylase UbiE
MLTRVDYDQKQHAGYAQGRAVDAEELALWMRAFAAVLPVRRPLAILDLGSGTGRFTPALAKTFGGPVYGVEPSTRMREVALRSAPPPEVTYLAGSAERIPLPDRSCDAVLMFLSFHHVGDRPAAAVEIARVLRPEGRLLIRSPFADRLPDQRWYRFFRRARAIEREMFPTLGEVEAVFGAVGLKRLVLETVRSRYTASLAETAARLRLRAISTFEHMSEEEIAEGFAQLERAVAAETAPEPVDTASDLLVLGQPTAIGATS